MNVLVAYATERGSTRGIAEAVADRLRAADHTVAQHALEEVGTIDGYDAIVLGSAIHNGSWLPAAAAFLREHADELASRPVWLFSVGSVGETSSFLGPRSARLFRRMQRRTQERRPLAAAIHPRGHRNFAGVIERGDWPGAGNLFLRAFGGRYGDRRDWRDIDRWADGIAAELRAGRTAASA